MKVETRMVGDLEVMVGWEDDWFRINYPEAVALFGPEVGTPPILFRHRFIDETLQLPASPEWIGERINGRGRRWSGITMTSAGVADWRHRPGCEWRQRVVADQIPVDVIGESVSIDDELCSIVRCPTCLRTATLTMDRRREVIGAPFSIGGYLGPGVVKP